MKLRHYNHVQIPARQFLILMHYRSWEQNHCSYNQGIDQF